MTVRVLVLGLLVTLHPAQAAPAPGQPTRSDICGGCHRDIYAMWKESAHGRSLDNLPFLRALREVEERDGSQASRACLDCHAPLARVTLDGELRLKTTWDGVGCDVCHSIRAVEQTPAGPRPRYDLGPVKRGPIRDAASTAHEVAYSELHTDVMICAACHEYVNPEGVALMSTWSEWKESPAAREGRNCQSCHMGLTKADVVDPKIKRVAAEVNLHAVPGGHSLDQLHRALAVGIAPRRVPGALEVAVTLTNKGAGHAVPTGMPGRRIVLEVWSDGASEDARGRRLYAREFRNADGTPIVSGNAYFSRGVRAGEDTRLKAGERRTESFRIPVADAAAATVHVKLTYEHAPSTDPQDTTRIPFFHEVRNVPPAGRS